MIGTLLNTIGIVIGGIAGLCAKNPLPIAVESWSKITLGAFTVYYGLRLVLLNLNGSPGHIIKQLLIVILALTLGRLVGRLLGLQKISNRLGQNAKQTITVAATTPSTVSQGFKVCSALYCAAPLGIVGAIEDGLSGYFYPLLIKGLIEGLGTMGLARILGWGTMLSALPVLALQGTISLTCSQFVGPFLEGNNLIWALNAVGGMLIFTVALVILQIKRIELADYLPSLVVAPLIAALWS